MRTGNLNNIKKQRKRATLDLKVDGHRYKSAVIRGSPGICGEVEVAGVFLPKWYVLTFELMHFECGLTCSILAIRWRVRAKIVFIRKISLCK